ncbi:MAG: AI-2E family transporter [Patescibacteria group bacterium]
MTHSKVRPYFLVLALAGTCVLTALVFAPFLKPLALAAVFAVVLQGLYRRVGTVFRGWPSISALVTVLVSVVLIVLPLSLIGTLVAHEANMLYLSLESTGGGRTALAQMVLNIDASYGSVVPGLSAFAENASANIDAYIKEGLRWVTDNAGGIFSSFSRILLSFFIFFIALYYLLRDGKRVRQFLIHLSPLGDIEDTHVLDRLELAVNSVIKGNLVIALVQGTLTTIGLTLFGVPSAILWGMVAAIAALIPGVGTSLVLAPSILFLFFVGETSQAVGLLIWSVIAVGLIDNVLGPKLVGQGMNMHPLLVLLSVLGGLLFFGPSGIFLGPLSVSLLFALLSLYTDFSHPPQSGHLS